MKKSKSIPDPGPLRLLIAEDSPVDAELIQRELRRAGISFTSRLVDGKREFNKSLAEFRPQVILSDFKMPGFDGLAALEIARLRYPDIPFIFVSGSIGEDKAIETLSLGASDYILKDNLTRLGPAVKRVIAEALLKLEKVKNEEELRLLAEAADRFVHINDLDKIYDYLASTICDISGADYLLLSLYDDKLQALRPKIATGFEPFRERMRRRFHSDPMEMIFYLKDMRPDDFHDFVSRRLLPVRDGLYGLANRKIPRAICRLMEKLLGIGGMHNMGFSWENQLFGGVTVFFKKSNILKNGSQIEALVNLAAVAIKRLLTENSLRESDEQLRESEEYYRTLVQTSPDAIIIIDDGGRITFSSQKALEIFGVSINSSLKGIQIADFVEASDILLVRERLAEILSGRSLPKVNEYRLLRQDRQPFWAEVSSAPLRDSAGKSISLLLVLRDISKRKRVESERQALEEIMLGLTASKDLHDFLRIVHQSITKVIYAENFFAVLYNKNTALFEEAYSVDKFDTTFFQPSSLEKSISRYIFRTGKPLLLSQAAFDRLEASGEVELVGTNAPSWLGVPLKTSRETIGVMVVQDYETEDRYSERDLDFLVSISGQVALVVERKRIEAEILREKAFLEALVETAPQGIAITDCTGRVQRVNPEFVRMFGYKANEAVGKSINDLVAPREYLEEAYAITLSTGTGETSFKETIRKRKDGTLIYVSIIGVPIFIAEQQVAVYAIYSDISDRKRAEERIQYQAGLLQNVSDAIIATDNRNDIQAWNKAAERIYGWKAEEAIGKNFHSVIKPEYRFQSREEVVEKLDREGAWSGEIIHHLRDGRQIPVQSTITILKDAAGARSGLVSSNHDISERLQAEELLRERDQLLKNLSAQVPGMIYTFLRKPDGTYSVPYSSNAIQDIFGVSPQAVTQDAAAIFNPILAEDKGRVVATIEDSARTLMAWQAEYRVQLPRQPVRWILGQSDPVRLADGSILWYGFNTDITERKQAEELIRNSLKEKEVLLQEIHHRVKNNLQIISGLLTLQADQATGKSLDEIFRESQDRIRSIALIHEKLYRSHNLAEIAFDEYLRSLTENLFSSHGVAAGRITAKYEMESIFFTIEKAIPLGLIVNELVSNSLKHAFPDGRKGEIRIELHGHAETKSIAAKTDSGGLRYTMTYELIVADDGVGLPSGFDVDTQKSLGMHLVSMLSRQLQAELKIKNGPGVEFKLTFSGLGPGKVPMTSITAAKKRLEQGNKEE